jgi:hypothetical protein
MHCIFTKKYYSPRRERKSEPFVNVTFAFGRKKILRILTRQAEEEENLRGDLK